MHVSERRACAALGQHRSTQRRVPRGRDDEEQLTADLIALARQYGRYGYRKIAGLLEQAGWLVNDKRVERIWRREGLKVPRKQPKRGRLWLADGSCIRLRASPAPQSRLVLRFCRGPDPRWTEISHAQCDRRVHPRMSGDPGRPQAQGHRCDRGVVRSLHPAWRAWPHPVRQSSWPRPCRSGSPRSAQTPPTSHPVAPGRMATSRASTHACAMNCSMANLLHVARGSDRHRKLATSLQHDQASRIARLQATCTGSVRTSLRRVASCATSTGFAGHASTGQLSTNIPTGPLRGGQ